MQYRNAAIVAAGLMAQQGAATGWLDFSAYSSPDNTDVKCTEKQQGGFNWEGLDTGSFDSYGGNKFSGWECKEDGYGKRDVLTKRTFGSKHIQGKLHSNPSWSCDQDDESMSIDEMEVSSSEDTDIDCEYSMPDGSVCKETHSCSSGGSIIKNSQCGGAKSVTFKPGKNSPRDCDVGVHHVGFHCGPSEYQSASESSSSAAMTSSTSVPSSPETSSTAAVSSSASAYESSFVSEYSPETTSSMAEYPGLSSSSSKAALSSSAPASYGSESSSTPVSPEMSSSSPAAYSSSSAPVVESSPVAYKPSSSVGSVSSKSIPVSPEQSTSSAPAVYESASSSVPVSPEQSTSSAPAEYEGASSSPAISMKSSSPAAAPSTSTTSEEAYPTPDCPSTVPKCLNTWKHVAACKDNTDSECFCKSEEMIKKVMGCISSWSDSDKSTSDAASYLMGICAPHVPENPAIVTACPTTVTPKPTPEETKPAEKPTPEESKPVVPIPYESKSASEEVPAVSSSIPVSPEQSSPVPYGSKPATKEIPAVSSSAPAPYNTKPAEKPEENTSTKVIQSTETLYSTIETTITSGSTIVKTIEVPVTTAPATSGPAPYSSVPAATTPATTPAPTAGPSTVITYSSDVTVPVTYTTGVSAGFTQPDSYSTTQLITTVTVPQVAFTTSTITISGKETTSVGLGAGKPSDAPANTTPVSPIGGGANPPAPYGTGMVTSYAPAASSSPIVPVQEGSAAKAAGSFAGVVVAAVAVVAAL